MMYDCLEISEAFQKVGFSYGLVDIDEEHRQRAFYFDWDLDAVGAKLNDKGGNNNMEQIASHNS
jgi:hypothetical protein